MNRFRLAGVLALIFGTLVSAPSIPATALLFGNHDSDTSICANIGTGYDRPSSYPAGWPMVDQIALSSPPTLVKSFLEGGTTNWHCRTDTGLTTGGQSCVGWNNQSLCAGGVWSSTFPVGTPVFIGKQDLQVSLNGAGFPKSLTLIEWDFNGDGTYETTDSGPWPTAYGTTDSNNCSGCPFTSRTTKAAYFEGTTRFATVGQHTISLRATYSDNSTTTSVGTFTAVADAVSARLSAPTIVLSSSQVTLDASSSTSSSGVFSDFKWDLDGDGTFETSTGTTSSTTTSWTTRGMKTVGVRVTSRGGEVASAQTSVEVRPTPPDGDIGVSIDDGSSFTNSKQVNLNLVWPSYATQVKVSNDGGFAASRTRSLEVQPSIPWDLDDSVTGRFPKVVYVRFVGSGVDGTRTFQDDILLDTTAPVITSATSAKSTSSGGVAVLSMSKASLPSSSARSRAFNIRLKARDNMSGISSIQVNARARAKGAKSVPFTRTITVRTGGKSIWMRVSDGAGNYSRWRQVRLPR